jgi:VWFA-related protein
VHSQLKRLRLAAIAALMAGVPGTASLSAHQKPQATFKSSIELINVDVVVIDKDGNAVRGLKQTDFALTDRKKPQTVSTFEEVSHERALAAPAPATMFPAAMKMDVVDNQTSQADRLVIVVIDDLHIWKGRSDKARDVAKDVVVKLGAQASMAVLFTSGEHSTQVTQDRSQLIAAVNTLQGRQAVRRPHQAIDDQKAVFNESGFSKADDALLKTMDNMSDAQKVNLQDFQDNMRQFQVLNDAAKMLRVEDNRRKAFVLISEGMMKNMSGVFDSTQSPCEASGLKNAPKADYSVDLDFTCYHDRALRDMSESLRRSNVATYAIDPRGKVRPEDMMLESFPPPDCGACGQTPPPNGADGDDPSKRTVSGEDSQFKWNNPVRMSQDSLRLSAEATGGFAVTDTDDFASGLQHIIEDIDHYYLLGFYPTDSGGGDKYRPLDVTVPAHPDWTVRFRRGYTPGAPPAAAASKDPLVALANGVMPKSDLPLRMTAMPLVGKGKNASVAIALEVTAPTGMMKDADSKLRDDVTYALMVVDDKKAKVTSRTGRAASFAMSAKNPAAAMPDTVTYQIPVTLDLPPGEYQIRASAMSKKLGKGGSVYFGVTVPDFTKEPLVLSGIAIGYADGSHVPVGRKTGTPDIVGTAVALGSARPGTQQAPYAGLGGQIAKGTTFTELPDAVADASRLPFDPSLNREFTRADVLRTYFEVARKDMTTTVALTVMVLDANNKPVMAIDKSVGPGNNGKVDFQVPLAPLAPGANRIRVTGTDTRSVAMTETGIIVR